MQCIWLKKASSSLAVVHHRLLCEINMTFDIGYTNKAHVLIDHLPQVIEKTGRGLFWESEQVVEATHAKFDKFWQRYKVLDPESEIHGKRLLDCVNDFFQHLI